jgi:hypothetical protein
MKKNVLVKPAACLLALTLAGTSIPVDLVSANEGEPIPISDENQTTPVDTGATTPDAGTGDTAGSTEGTDIPSDVPSDMPPSMPGGGGGDVPPSLPEGGGGFSPDTMVYDYTGTYTGALSVEGETKSSDGETIAATDKDQNAILVQKDGVLKVTNGTITKSGDDTSGDPCNFYGINSIVLSVHDGATAYISDSKISADSVGSNALFATDGGVIYALNDTIETTADNSRGMDATYGGTVVADQMTISTKGAHCAAIANDRGGGNVSATNSTFTTEGSGSPILYSTGTIEVSNITATANGSQIAGMEGFNTIRIYNSDLTSTITSKTASDPVANGVILYQSMSGDADTSTGKTAEFDVTDSKLTSKIESGTMFYVTNVTAKVALSNTTLDFDSSKANLITAIGNDSNGWGTAGSNGGLLTFTGRNQILNGKIQADTISSVDLYLLDASVYTGSTEIIENEVNTKKTDAPITINVDASSSWVVTADSTVTNLNVEEGGKVVDEAGDPVTIVADGKTVVEGTSGVTVTVTGSYNTTFTLSSVNEISSVTIDRSAFDSYYGTSTVFGTTENSGNDGTDIGGNDGAEIGGENGSDNNTGTETQKPEKTAIKNVSSASVKKLTVKWTKQKGVDGYQIMLSTNKSFTKNTVKKNVAAKATSKTVSGLTKNKRYYAKVRAYKLVDGKKVYGAWSKVLSAKTAKK